ncbi:WAS/WASL-interacting protein family member 3 isoform X2 [Bombina bombina]|uniref:WAS/WASL-interacting protein family member 3 isoform X2 n=1 Tax=Bombina bombina TaxID=8345 RepID=UPI00235A767B|nr:WAS/WASL-interacting protein family member 3 isoform X2 [Bombina bombina]
MEVFFMEKGRSAPVKPKQELSGRSALLSDIEKGARLKKVAQTNDRSAPQIQNAKKNSENVKGSGLPTPGGLFARGFPALKPMGQRDTPGTKIAVQASGPRASSPKPQELKSNNRKYSESSCAPDPPKPANNYLSSTCALRTPPPRPNILGTSYRPPPPVPPTGSKPQLHMQPSSAGPPFKERSAKNALPNPPPIPPPLPQEEKPSRNQDTSHTLNPAPSALLLHPGFHGRKSEFLNPSPPPNEDMVYANDLPPPPFVNHEDQESAFEQYDEYPLKNNILPPPPPPLPSMSLFDKRRLSEPFPPPPNYILEQSRTHPSKPQPSPPPIPGRLRRNAVPPPAPPPRSPNTELSNNQRRNSSPQTIPLPHHGFKGQHQRDPPQEGNRKPKRDDFESKFSFHTLEDVPPPEIFVFIERIYPSRLCGRRQEPPSPPPPPPPMRHQR